MRTETLSAAKFLFRADPTIDPSDIPVLLDRLRHPRAKDPAVKPDLFRLTEVARSLNVSRWTLRRWIDAGRLKSVRIGGVVRIRRSDLETLIANDQ